MKQAVKRNAKRFPLDFMFELNKAEWQEVITICDNLPLTAKFSPTTPMVFTEQGVAMLSSVLRSERAIDVNISIMRAFVEMRRLILGYSELMERIEQLEINTDAQFNEIYQALAELASKKAEENKPRRAVGFNANKEQ